jgi:pimeloyl-ACP methyl ester carboxylesterase
MNERASLTVDVGDRSVAVEVLLDGPDDPVGAAIVVHGFARGPKVLDAVSGALVQRGIAVARPAIKSFGRKDGLTDPAFLDALAPEVAALLPSGVPVVVMGHSAGGGVAALIAARLLPDVAGLVLVDPNESLTPMLVPGVQAVAELGRHSIRVAAAEPGRCNRRGLGPRTVMEHDAGALVVRMVGGTHCEIEADAADLVCRTLCGGRSDGARVEALHALLGAWVSALAAPDHEPAAARVLDDLVGDARATVLQA